MTHKLKPNLPGRRQSRVGAVRVLPLSTHRRGYRGRPAQRPSPTAAASRPAPTGQPAAADGAVQPGVARLRPRSHHFVDGGDHVDRHGRRGCRGRGHGGGCDRRMTSAHVGEAPPATDGGCDGGGRVGATESAAALEGARVAGRRSHLLVRPQRTQRGPQALQLIFSSRPVGRSIGDRAAGDDAAVPVAGHLLRVDAVGRRGLAEGVEARGDLHHSSYGHRDHTNSHLALSVFIAVATHSFLGSKIELN